ncbi:MAG: TIGR01777 family protein, partial [Moraxellaceae bacterium]
MTLYTAGAILWAWLDISRGRFWSGKSINEPVIEALTKSNQRILVTGGTGFIGRPLCQAFINQGHSVTVLTRNINNAAAQFRGRITFIESLDLLKDSDEFDIVINLAGEPISQRWSESARRKIIESRVNTTSALVEFIKRSQRKPSVFISGSAIGIYGTDEEKKFSETTQSVNDLIGQYPRTICEQWEAVAKEMESFHVRTCLLRTGVVLEIDGGALAQMLFPFGFCLGGRMGSGNQWFSWIHREDLIRLIVHLINNDDISGPVNATAPEPVTNK